MTTALTLLLAAPVIWFVAEMIMEVSEERVYKEACRRMRNERNPMDRPTC